MRGNDIALVAWIDLWCVCVLCLFVWCGGWWAVVVVMVIGVRGASVRGGGGFCVCVVRGRCVCVWRVGGSRVKHADGFAGR